MPRSFAPNPHAVTGNVLADLPATLDAIERQSRAAADEFIRRDAQAFAVFAGMSAQLVSRQREIVEGVKPAIAKVASLVFAGRACGRSTSEVSAFLAPICDVAGCDFAPRVAVLGTIGVQCAAAESLREGSEAISASIIAVQDGSITEAECQSIEREIDEAVTALHRLKREAQAAVRKPMRGKAFTQSSTQSTKGNR